MLKLDVRKSIPRHNIIEILKICIWIKTYFSQKSVWHFPLHYQCKGHVHRASFFFSFLFCMLRPQSKMKQGFIKTPSTLLSRQHGVCFVSALFSTLHLFKCPKMKDTSKFSVKKIMSYFSIFLVKIEHHFYF